VRWAQNSLNRILSIDLAVDGVMNPETRNAVRIFQQQQGLPVTGIIGPDTQEALLAATRGQTAGSPVSEEAFFGIPSIFSWSPPSRIIDLTSQAEKSQRKAMRDLRKVDTLVLHQSLGPLFNADILLRVTYLVNQNILLAVIYFSALRCGAWLKLKRLFGTGNASVAVTSGRPKARASLHGARSAKARTGTNHGKTSALWRLAQDRVLASRVSGDREGMRRVVDAILHYVRRLG
jgi:peptidoglycan hydrolase-like protein with peptidoglycan-binding domain